MRPIIISVVVCLALINLTSAFDRSRDCKCRIQASSRIINGHQAASNAYPWQTSMQAGDIFQIPDMLKKMLPDKYKVIKHSCGATIVNNRWVLIAAHCIPPKDSISRGFFKIGHSQNDLVKMFDNSNYFEIEEAFVHEKFGMTGYGALNDIALIKLKKPIKFDKNVQPACLGVENVEKYDGALKITGWGSTKTLHGDLLSGEMEEALPTRFLNEAETFDLTDEMEMCEGRMKEQICTNNQNTGMSSCKGDSGGPLHHTKNGRTSVIGVTSWGEPEIGNNFEISLCLGPTAYTRVSNYMEWIKSHIGDDFCY